LKFKEIIVIEKNRGGLHVNLGGSQDRVTFKVQFGLDLQISLIAFGHNERIGLMCKQTNSNLVKLARMFLFNEIKLFDSSRIVFKLNNDENN